MQKIPVCVCAIVISALSLCAADKTWTGGAGDLRTSSADNWNPAGTPDDGDALIFPNSAALNVTNDLSGYTFSGITVSGNGPVTIASGNAFSLSGNIAVTGTGVLNISVPVTVNGAVTATLSGADLYTYSPVSGSGSLTLEGSKSLYAKDAFTLAGGVIANNGKLFIEKTTFTAPVTLNQLRSNSVSCVALSFEKSGTYHIPVTISNNDGSGYTLTSPAGVYVTNTASVTLAPGTYTRWLPYGSLTLAGGIIEQGTLNATAASIIFNGNTVIRDVPLAFGNVIYVDSGSLRFAVAGNTYASLKCFTETIYTDVAEALDPNSPILFGVNYKKVGRLDLNGNSQTINRPALFDNGGLDSSSYVLTSSSGPATLTCRGTASSTFFGSLDGALSLSWEPLADAYAFTVTGRTSQTSGSLSVTAGTLSLAAGSAFPNIAGLAASGTGILSLEGAALPAVPLTLSDTALLALPDGQTFSCLRATVDGHALTTGVYTAAHTVGGRTFITGSGSLTVLTIPLSGTVRTWTGAGADTLFSNPANWDAAPAFDGSETLLFAASGSAAIVDGDFRLGALRFDRSTSFTLTQADASSALRLGLGGITALTPSGAPLVTNTLAVPLALFLAHEFQIGSNQTLAVSGTLSGGTPVAPLVKTGYGTLRLTGTNTFESPLVISNGFINVNTGTALGNPTNTISIQYAVSTADSWNRRGPLYFTDAAATNSRPLIMGSAGSFLGQAYARNASLVLNGKFTFSGNGRIDNQGTLLFRGGFECRNAVPWMQTQPGFVMRFEGQPLNLGTQSISIDNGGTFHVSTASNTWSSIGLYSATFLCGAANVLPTNSYVTFGVSYSQRGFLDLNGFNQQVKYITFNASSSGGSTNMLVRSAAPATLTLEGDSSVRTFIGAFTNQASLCHRNTGTLAFTGATSASYTTGDLRIEAGTVAFRNGATWKGSTNVTVTAGTLSLEGGSGATFGGNRTATNVTRLHLTSASHVNLAAGVTEYVNAATLDGKPLPIGSYGAPGTGANYTSALFTGSGLLYVMRDESAGTLIKIF